MAHIDQMFTQKVGTIAASGSLSPIYDTEGFSVHGLIVRRNSGSGTLVAGTVQFRVGFQPGTVYPLYDNTNTRVGLVNGTSDIAYSWASLQVIRPYRYVQIETVANQTQAVDVILALKGANG